MDLIFFTGKSIHEFFTYKVATVLGGDNSAGVTVAATASAASVPGVAATFTNVFPSTFPRSPNRDMPKPTQGPTLDFPVGMTSGLEGTNVVASFPSPGDLSSATLQNTTTAELHKVSAGRLETQNGLDTMIGDMSAFIVPMRESMINIIRVVGRAFYGGTALRGKLS